MNITIDLTDEQVKALLTEYVSIEGYAQVVLENRANRIMKDIIKRYANNLKDVTTEEQTAINTALSGKIIVDVEDLPKNVGQIIVKRAKTKTMVQKIAEQTAMEDTLASENVSGLGKV